MVMSKHTPGPWTIHWYVCTAAANDVAHAKSEGRAISVGDEFWRVPFSIGPLSIDHNHWAGDHLEVSEDDARLIAAAPDMLEALIMLRDADDIAVAEGYSCGMGDEQRAAVDEAIAKATGGAS